MPNVRHQKASRDSLFEDIAHNLETIYRLWADGNISLRFTVPILCAAKLEAFINVAGKLNVKHWDILERKLSFTEKCKVVFSSADLVFDPQKELNKDAISTFEIRNSLVHPKMRLDRIDEKISYGEYERRRIGFDIPSHHLRAELNKGKVMQLKLSCDEFVSHWGNQLLDSQADYWLSVGSTGEFSFDTKAKD